MRVPALLVTSLLVLALVLAVLAPGAPVPAGCLVAAALVHRLAVRHHLLHRGNVAPVFSHRGGG